MISEAHKFIYIHPAKTGGTSVEVALEPHSENELRVGAWPLGNPQVIRDGKNIKHARLDRFRHRLGTERLADYFVFATCRNPWDRMVSAWCWFNRIHDPVTFGEWCSFLSRRRVKGPSLNNDHRTLRQLIDPCVDFVRQNPPFDVQWIRFERLQDDFDDICADLDLPQVELTHELKTEHAHYSTYYDDEQRERVARFFKRDIRQFGYSFEAE